MLICKQKSSGSCQNMSDSEKWLELIQNLYNEYEDWNFLQPEGRDDFYTAEIFNQLISDKKSCKIENPKFTESQFQEFNKVIDIIKLNRAVKNTVDCITSDLDSKSITLIIKGDNVKFSEFIGDDGNLKNVCPNKKKIKMVYIFALNAVLIDTELKDVRNEFKVAVVAPKWITTDRKHTITLEKTNKEKKNSSHVHFFGVLKEVCNASEELSIDDIISGENVVLVQLSNVISDLNKDNEKCETGKELVIPGNNFDLKKIVIEYKEYVKKSLNVMNHSYKVRFLNDILNTFNNKCNIRDTYCDKFKELINDYQNLEKRYYENAQQRDKLLPDYKLLQYRISEYPIESFRNYYFHEEYQKVLSYLLTAVLSRVLLLRETTDYHLFVDLKECFTSARNYFENFITNGDNFYLLNIFELCAREYLFPFNSKADNVHDTIDKALLPEFKTIKEAINKNVDSLINELIQNEESEEKLNAKKTELKNCLVTKVIFDGSSYLGLVLSYLSSAADTVKTSLDMEFGTRYDTFVEDFRRNVKLLLKTADSIKVTVTPENELYNKYKDQKDKLNVVQEVNGQIKSEFVELKDFEKQIHDTCKSMIDYIANRFSDLNSTLDRDTFFKTNFKIDQWQVQSTLKELKPKIHRMIKKYNIKDNLVGSLEKLAQMTKIMIDLYDYTEYYDDNKKISRYLEKIPTASPSQDPVLTKLVTDLDKSIINNLMIHRYKVLRNALIAYVFPFASIYLEGSKLPSQLEQIMNYEDLRNETYDQIKNLVLELDFYENKYGIVDYGAHGIFRSGYVSTKPFFVWQNDENKEMISKLLSGQDVLVYADPKKADLNFAKAIKANVLEFKIRAKNETMNDQLARALNGYKICAYHLGDENYRFNDKYYSIPMCDMRICTVYEDYEQPRKHQEKGFKPSPFALWKLELLHMMDNEFNDDLMKYKDDVDLTLEGEADYVFWISERNKYEESKVLNWYVPIGTVDESNRRKRSIDEQYATNSAALSLTSPINYLCNLVQENVLKIKHLNPVELLKGLFYGHDITEYDSVVKTQKFHESFSKYEDSKSIGNVVSDGLLENGIDVEMTTNMFINNGTEYNHVLGIGPYDLFNNQNLALLNLAVHKFSKVKYDQKLVIDNIIKNEENLENAQRLAFAAQIPKNVG